MTVLWVLVALAAVAPLWFVSRETRKLRAYAKQLRKKGGP